MARFRPRGNESDCAAVLARGNLDWEPPLHAGSVFIEADYCPAIRCRFNEIA